MSAIFESMGGGSFRSKTFTKRKVSRVKLGKFQRGLVFIIAPLKGMKRTLSPIKDECAKLGLNAITADEMVGAGFVIEDIYNLIEDAEFIICDLTMERPNVYYELGYAHGVGNHPFNMLLIAKEGTLLHFDIAPLRVKYYRSASDLRSLVSTNLLEMMRVTRGQG